MCAPLPADGGNLAPRRIPDALQFLGCKVHRAVQDFLRPPHVLQVCSTLTTCECPRSSVVGRLDAGSCTQHAMSVCFIMTRKAEQNVISCETGCGALSEGKAPGLRMV